MNFLMVIAALMSIAAGFLAIYDYFSQAVSPGFAFRFFLILSLYIIFSICYLLKKGFMRKLLTFFGVILLLLSIPLFINPWHQIQKVTAYLGAIQINSWAKNNRIQTEFDSLRFSGFLNEERDHKWCQDTYRKECRAASFKLLRSTPPPWRRTGVNFTTIISSDDWILSGMEVFNLEYGKKLEQSGYPSSAGDKSIRRKDIILSSETFGFRVVVCGNPQKGEVARSAFCDILDLSEIEVKNLY